MKTSICMLILLLGIIHVISANPEAAVGASSGEAANESPEDSSPEASAEDSEEVSSPDPTTDSDETDDPDDCSEEQSPPPPPPPPHCIGECPTVDPPLGVYLPNSHCDRFCQCDRGAPVVVPCPPGLHYNAAVQVCDWPQSANCPGVGGVQPEPESPEDESPEEVAPPNVQVI